MGKLSRNLPHAGGVIPRMWIRLIMLMTFVTGLVASPATAVTSSDKVVELACATSIGGPNATPGSSESILFDAVALPVGLALDVSKFSDNPRHARWFAKNGLFIKAGANVALIVPSRWHGRFSLAFGSGPGRRYATRVNVSGCAAPSPAQEWLVYAGGYYVEDRACVPLIVRMADQSVRVHIGVGAPCASGTK